MIVKKCQARFFDGYKSTPYTVEVEILDRDLCLSLTEDQQITQLQWPFEQLQILETASAHKPAVICAQMMPNARLVLADLDFYQTLVSMIGKKQIQLSEVQHSWRNLGIFCLVTIAIFISLLLAIPLGAPWIAQHMPQSWEDQLGKWVYKIAVKNHPECTNPEGKKALEHLVQRLTEHTSIIQPLDVQVINFGNTNINAFALSGNHIIITSGLIHFVDDPDQLAAVLAHEMGHIIEHHPTQSLLRQTGLQMYLLATLGSSFDFATKLLQLNYSRKDEQQADAIGISILTHANINKQAYVKFFQKILKMERDPQADPLDIQFLSSHPGTQQRIEQIQNTPGQKNTQPSLTAKEWKALENICKDQGEIDLETQ